MAYDPNSTTPLITVTAGGPDIEPGVYTVVCTKLDGPKQVQAQRGPNAGQFISLMDWGFEVMDGPYAGTELRGSTSTASGPRSKMYAWLTALLGGTPPQEGDQFAPADLTGRVCLATITRDETGWPRIEQLSALPLQYQQAAQSQAFMGQQAAAQYPPQPQPPQRPQPAQPQQGPQGDWRQPQQGGWRGGPQDQPQQAAPTGRTRTPRQQAAAGQPDGEDLPF